VSRPIATDAAAIGRLPHISKQYGVGAALRRRISEGEIADHAELARLGHVSRARLTGDQS